MRLDTREDRPTLYNVIFMTVICVLLVAVILLRRGDNYVSSVNTVLLLYYFLMAVHLIYYFRRQVQYNLYSYDSIYYIGFGLFAFSLAINHFLMTLMQMRYPEDYTLLYAIDILLGSAKTYMIFSAPLILVFSLALCISNISLIRHEGYRFVNALGIILAFLLVGGEVFLFRADYYVSGSQMYVMWHDIVTNTFACIYLYFECMLIGSVVVNTIAARYEPEKDKDFLIVLGCGIRKDGTLTPLLKGRVDRARTFAAKQEEETGRGIVYIPSGGQGPDEVISESAAMANYLRECGVPEERIRIEDRSTDTFENMKYSKEIIDRIDPDAKVGYATTNYHVFRGGLYARRLGMRAQGMGAKTRWYFWPNAWVREFVGILADHRKTQAIILGSMCAVYVAMTLIYYLYIV